MTHPLIFTRRQALMTGLAATAMGIGTTMGKTTARAETNAAPHWLTLLGTSEQGGRDYAPQIEGEIPRDIAGVLYRNGPGLFERGGVRKRHLLDGDGLVQRLEIRDGRAHYRNHFVRTPKFVEEEQAGTLTHATWTTRAPGGVFSNLMGGDLKSQAGVTVYPVHGQVIARDETGPTFLLDPENLETQGTMGTPGSDGYKAHTKLDPATGMLIMAGQKFGPSMELHVATYDTALNLVSHHSFAAPRQVYIHDFFATEHYIVFLLQPAMFNPVPFLAGLKAFTQSITWKPEEDGIIALCPRDGGEARFYDVPSTYMWHALNAYEKGGEIIADFVGYDEPDHFLGENALFHTLMDGRMGKADALGTMRRYVIDTASGKAREEVLDAGNHEFPMTDPRVQLGEHRYAYLASGGPGGLNTAVKRLDTNTGKAEEFDFGPMAHTGEPVFIPGKGIDEGWLIVQCLDGMTEKTFFALFDAQSVDKGPVAKIHLTHHVPISFHGGWA